MTNRSLREWNTCEKGKRGKKICFNLALGLVQLRDFQIDISSYLLNMFSESAYFSNFSMGGSKSSGLVIASDSLYAAILNYERIRIITFNNTLHAVSFIRNVVKMCIVAILPFVYSCCFLFSQISRSKFTYTLYVL